jgi:mycofactocin precursor
MEQGTIEVDVDLHAFMADADEAQVDEELLVEEISIDGMCGVY